MIVLYRMRGYVGDTVILPAESQGRPGKRDRPAGLPEREAGRT